MPRSHGIPGAVDMKKRPVPSRLAMGAEVIFHAFTPTHLLEVASDGEVCLKQ
jgi:hypothetical protein